MKSKLLTVPLISLFLLSISTTAFAHGVKTTHQTKTAIELSAAFDTGEQLSEAQVTIFTPDNPTEPWSTGSCDKNGHYTFTPDFSKPGNWTVQIRQAGHGGLVNIPVGEEMASSGSTGYSPLKMSLMAACAAWGLVGTALFFSRRKS